MVKTESYEHIYHEFPPVFDKSSRILILGSLPSVKSREVHFYYGHPQNRFWKVMQRVFDWPFVPDTTEDKTAFLIESHVALWDVIAECDIIGSSDSSIMNAVPNDIAVILDKAPIERIYTNGGKACELYGKYILPKIGRPAVKLPSTSPANAAFSLDRLVNEWMRIKI